MQLSGVVLRERGRPEMMEIEDAAVVGGYAKRKMVARGSGC